MPDAPKNIENFNLIVGLVLLQLYESFPVEHDIDEEKIANAIGVAKESSAEELWPGQFIYNYGEVPGGGNFREFLWATLKWLRSEGIIRARGDIADRDVVLSAVGLELMKRTPTSLGSSFGDKLVEAGKDIGTDVGKSALSNVVGEFTGYVAKGLMGG